MPTKHLVKAIPRLLLALWLAIGPAWAGSMTLLGVGKVGAAVTPATLTFGQQASQATPTGPTVNYGTLSWGSSCDRVIVVASTTATTAGQTATAVASISGVGFTSIISVADASSGLGVSVFESNSTVPATSGAVSVTWGSWSGTVFFTTASVYCLKTTSPVSTANNSQETLATTTVTTSLAIPANGVGVVIGTSSNGFASAAANGTWNLDAASDGPTGHTLSGAAGTTATITLSGANSGSGMYIAAAAWGP